MKFVDLGLSPETLRAIEDVGYETPTPIQEKAIPHVLMGRDVLGIAQTGTGKTASFTLPMIEILANGRAKARMPRSLILAPTRELAAQVSENFTLYGKYHKLDMALLIGGESMGDQMRALDKGVDVLIATPGRLLDLFERGKILLRDVKVLVIDEADRMLDMGFIPDVERIVSLLPPLRQTLFFSATMDKEIRRLADAFLSNPREVSIERKATAAETVTQHLAMVPRIDKREALRHILRTENVRNAFIFCNRKRDVDVLNRSLKKHGFNCISLHGDMDQPTRNEMLRRFKDNEADLLVCSDVAARGLDIDDVSHVINFDIPTHSEDYVHRIGRTGRAGKEGAAFSLATPDDAKYVAGIEKLLGRAIPRLTLEGLDCVDAGDASGSNNSDGAGDGGDSTDRGPRDRRGGRDRSRSDRRDRKAARDSRDTRETRDSRDRPDRSEARKSPDDGGGRSRRGRGRRDDDVPAMSHPDNAVAFGDHTPAFFTFDTLVPMGPAVPDASAERDDDTDTETAGEARRGKSGRRGARASAQGAGKAGSASRRGERKRHGRKTTDPRETAAVAEAAGTPDETATTETAITETATTETAAEPGEAGAATDVPADPAADVGAETGSGTAPDVAPRKRRATRRKTPKADATAPGSQDSTGDAADSDAGTAGTSPEEAAPTVADDDAPPAKPKRTRRKTATASAADGETAADAAPKPKRTRRKTAAASATDGEAAADADAAPKPKRTRRKTAKPPVESTSDAGDAPGTDAPTPDAPTPDANIDS